MMAKMTILTSSIKYKWSHQWNLLKDYANNETYDQGVIVELLEEYFAQKLECPLCDWILS